MPTWGEILIELSATRTARGGPDFDLVRRKYLRQLHEQTGRAVILYGSAFLEKGQIPQGDLQVSLEDMQGFMEAVSNVEERQLDLILHSPGGSAEAAEAIVVYLRKRFDHVRVFVPLAAMSAATMIALSANEIFMGQHSQLGPIDPQFIISTPEGPRSAPAKAILQQFDLAKKDCGDPTNLAAWMPILRSYAPGLLTQCMASERLAVTIVTNWLKMYMFAGEPDAEQKAIHIAGWFGSYENFDSHSRRVGYDEALNKGLKVTRLEENNDLQDAVLSIHHAMMHTFSGAAVKLVENHHGRTWAKLLTQVVVPRASPQAPRPPQPAQPPPMNRAERRRQQRGGR